MDAVQNSTWLGLKNRVGQKMSKIAKEAVSAETNLIPKSFRYYICRKMAQVDVTENRFLKLWHEKLGHANKDDYQY